MDLWIYMDFHWFPWFFIDLKGSGARMSAARWHPEIPCAALWQPVPPDWIPLYIKISDPGGLDLKAWCLDAEGLEWIGAGDGGDGIMGRGDWKKFPHAQASGARRMSRVLAYA